MTATTEAHTGALPADAAPRRASAGTILHAGTSETVGCTARDLLLGLRDAGWSIDVACADDEWAQRLRTDGFRVWPIRLGARPALRELAAGARDLARLMRARPFSAIHTHNAHHGVVGRHIGALFGLAGFHTWRYDPIDAAQRRVEQVAYGLAEGSAARLSRAVMFQNEDDLEAALRRRIVPPDRAFLVGNGIITERYERPQRPRSQVRAELGIADDAQLVICVARLAERKGQPDLLRAARSLVDSHPRMRVLFVGTGPDSEAVRSLAAQLGISDRVLFVGQREDVADLLHASDVLCLPSRREGVPRAVMEAMAARVPVVATRVVGTRSLVEDNRSGLLVGYRDPAALAHALRRVLDDAELRTRIAECAATKIYDGWHQQRVVDRVGQLYEAFLLGGASSPNTCVPPRTRRR